MLPVSGDVALPVIPPSNRILSVKQVTNYWVNTLLSTRLPPQPNGLYPKKQQAWKSMCYQYNSKIRSIQNGNYNDEAQCVQLAHNAAAWRILGNEQEALKCESHLRSLQLHHAKIATLGMQRNAAHAQIQAAETLTERSSSSYNTSIIIIKDSCSPSSQAQSTSTSSEPFRLSTVPR